ncbi:hypothetical protein ACH4SK_38815 [Streptomyces inhibens]|uniref:hypothetical protein n=1 Tax=Streptomyces inhibens TaxID=2293571 RepID=UPI0037AD3612
MNGTNTPAWQHYETALRPGLRKALAARRTQTVPAPRQAQRLREQEDHFWQSLAALLHNPPKWLLDHHRKLAAARRAVFLK